MQIIIVFKVFEYISVHLRNGVKLLDPIPYAAVYKADPILFVPLLELCREVSHKEHICCVPGRELKSLNVTFQEKSNDLNVYGVTYLTQYFIVSLNGNCFLVIHGFHFIFINRRIL